ncbi:MAG: ComEC family competence protein [Synergistaceae bacterium]|jgi:competence protein ComEC|nr:ComEC family competence protein [Synergistaceae bacterium]
METHGRVPTPAEVSPLARAPAFALLSTLCAFLVFREDMSFAFISSAAMAVALSAGWYLLGAGFANERSLPVVCVLLLSAALGLFVVDYGISRSPLPQKLTDETGVVLSARKWGYSNVALVKINSRGYLNFRSDKYVLRDTPENCPEPGDIVRFSGVTRPFRRADAPGDFDEFLYWKSKGAAAYLESANISVVGKSRGISYFRAFLTSRASRVLPPLTAGYITASWTGEKDANLSEFHRNAGTSHLLAVSGLHVGIVYGIFCFLLRRVKHKQYIISALIWTYVALSGASPSSVRAAVMLQMIIIGRMIGSPGNAFNTTCFAGSVMLATNPWLFWDVGWRLSVLSVLTLSSLASTRMENGVKLLLASPAVWLVTSVQSSWTFGDVPMSGLVINLFAVPAFAALLPLASVLSMPSVLGFEFGIYPAGCAEFLFAAWERMSNNITFLLPQKTSFSYPLLVCGALTLVYLFANACGFSHKKILVAEAVNIFCLCFLLYNVVI